MIKIKLKEESNGWWTITTDKDINLGTYRPSSIFKAKEWCKAYLSSWNENFYITVIYNGKNYTFDDDIKVKSPT